MMKSTTNLRRQVIARNFFFLKALPIFQNLHDPRTNILLPALSSVIHHKMIHEKVNFNEGEQVKRVSLRASCCRANIR